MDRDKRLALKVASFTALGFLYTTCEQTFVNSRLTTHVMFGARDYALGYWIAFLAPVVFLVTYLPLALTRNRLVAVSWPLMSLAVFAAVTAPNFRPSCPHGGILSWLFLYGLVGAVTVAARITPLKAEFLSRPDIARDMKIERVKETALFWRTLAVGVGIGYLALIVPWGIGIWAVSERIVTSKSEVLLCSMSTISSVGVFSVYVLCGPLYELIDKAHKAADLLLQIPADPVKP